MICKKKTFVLHETKARLNFGSYAINGPKPIFLHRKLEIKILTEIAEKLEIRVKLSN